MSVKLHRERYQRASEAMHAAVEQSVQIIPNPEFRCKNLRIGINKTHIEVEAILHLLMQKGLITEEEYMEAIADAMEGEVHRYELFLTEKLGYPVSLLS